MNVIQLADFFGISDADFDEEDSLSRYDLFRLYLLRAAALVTLQDFLSEIIKDEEEDAGPDFVDIAENSGIPEVEDISRELKDSFEPISKKIEAKKKSLEKSMEEPDKREKIKKFINSLLKLLEPLLNLIVSLDMVSKKPLYPEAVVSSVTTFETFLKDSMISLVSDYLEVEKRFTPELKEWVTYEKLKEFDYDREKAIGLIVADKINFYDMEEVDEYFRRAFGKKDKKNWSIFPSKKSRQKIQNYIHLRHLIVHKGGVVDSKFKRNTQCKDDIGEAYVIESDYIEDILKEMFRVGAKIWKCMEMMKENGECK